MSNNYRNAVRMIEMFVDGTNLDKDDYQFLLDRFIISKNGNELTLTHVGKFILKNKGKFLDLPSD